MRKLSSELRGFGRVVTGSVADCDKNALERSLQFYDPYLYIKWNTDKLGGRGCWEIRRAPEFTTLVYQGKIDGQRLFTAERVESDFIHHVLDCPVLHYGIVGKIKSMDAWKYKDFDQHLVDAAEAYDARERRRARAEMAYDLKQFKQEWRDMNDLLQQGANPAQFITGIKG